MSETPAAPQPAVSVIQRFSALLGGGGAKILKLLWQSLLIPVVCYTATVWWIGESLNPWKLGWIRPDEAATIAEDFLLKQDADLQVYTTVAAAEYRRSGEWRSRDDEWAFSVNPSIGYLHRFFRKGVLDSWTVGVSPTGQVYRVAREQYDDDPGSRLSRGNALELVLSKLSGELGVDLTGLGMVRDTLIVQPQRHDWQFSFAWSDTSERNGTIDLTIAGNAITELSFRPDSTTLAARTVPARTPSQRRVQAFLLMLLGVFIAVQQHRTPLAMGTAAVWGGCVFVFTIVVRGLTFPQAMLLIPTESPYAGYLARVALSAVVDALQNGIVIGLIVATGEALWRDRLPKVASLSRVVPDVKTRGQAWQRAARWGLITAAGILLVEAIAMHYFGIIGLLSNVPKIVASSLSSPAPSAALPSLTAFDMLWDEGLYRLWLIPLMMLLFRAPLAIVLSSAIAVYFQGYDFQQMLTVGAFAYALWSVVAGTLAVRFGIYAALLFHVYVLGGYAALALIWTGFGTVIGATLLALLLLVIAAIAVQPHEPAAA